MIVVPALAHAQQRRDRQVRSLDRRPTHDPALRTLAMREITDEPMTRHANADAHGYAPPPNSSHPARTKSPLAVAGASASVRSIHA